MAADGTIDRSPTRPAPRRFGFIRPASLDTPLVRIAILIGLAERIFWGMRRQIHGATGEAAHVAVAWAQGHGFADAFMPGQGPTAHLLPVTPLIGGIVYRLFGIQSQASEIVLFTMSQVMIFGTFLLFARCFERLGSPPGAIRAAFVLLCVLPIYTTVEAFDFRLWEGAYGLALGAFALLVILAVDQALAGRPAAADDPAASRSADAAGDAAPRRAPPPWARPALALLPPITFFVNPAVGIATFAALALLLIRRRTRLRAWPIVAGALLMLAALIGPWLVRNIQVMHHPIVLRDNVGLELAVANFPAALGEGDFDAIFENHLQAIHPRDHPLPFRAMVQAGGEVAYARLMGDRAKAWIAAHPRETAQLWVRHVREMLFTRRWMFQTAHGRQLPLVRATLATLIGLLGLIGLVRRAAVDQRSWYVAAFVVLPVACYVPFQPIMRYTWLLYPVMTYYAADLIAWLRVRRLLDSRVAAP